MGVAWRAFFAALHVVTLTAVWVLFWRQGIVDPRMYEEAKRDNAADALHFALQVGRLDIISLILAAFGIFAGVAAIFGFIEVRHRAKDSAREEAEAYLEKHAGRLFAEAVRARGGGLSDKAPLPPLNEQTIMQNATEVTETTDGQTGN